MSAHDSTARGLGISRRQFLVASGASAAAAVAGCAINPVTGRRELMFYGESDEVAMDTQSSPHQFSADYGAVQDARINQYVTSVGQSMASLSHRPRMPYNYRCVNASYVNAYTFPGGSMATTRGILLDMDNESELAALLGHELAHVNARHTAARMSKGALISGALGGVGMVLKESAYGDYADTVMGIGGLGASLMLARYSRDDEREADQLGMEYMVRAGHPPTGMIGLMDMLRSMHKSKPSVIEQMFASHPMSDERYKTAADRAQSQYAKASSRPANRERYMDNTASLRRIAPALKEIQKGDEMMAKKQPDVADGHYASALRQASGDYEGLLKLAKCKLARDKPSEAVSLAAEAKTAYPAEPQAYQVHGFACLASKQFSPAVADFTHYDKALPGNPNTLFLLGFAHEGLNQKQNAATQYANFLKKVTSGTQADHATKRLTEWGYLKAQQ